MDGLANAAGHTDRHRPLRNYCKGLLLPGARKSVEPMAARLAPDNVRRMHQSLHHLVADAPWNDEEMLAQVRRQVLPTMEKHGPVVAWIVDDTGFPKQGKHSVGVARQYCGQVGKQANCQAAVSLSVSSWSSSLPIAWRLYLPEVWCQDRDRCRQAGVPEGMEFQTKPEIALAQIRQAVEQKVPVGVILADAGYGNGTPFRAGLTQLGRQYMVGVESSTTVWEPGQQPLLAPPRKPGRGAPPKRLQRNADHQPISVKQLALGLPSSAWKDERGVLFAREHPTVSILVSFFSEQRQIPTPVFGRRPLLLSPPLLITEHSIPARLQHFLRCLQRSRPRETHCECRQDARHCKCPDSNSL